METEVIKRRGVAGRRAGGRRLSEGTIIRVNYWHLLLQVQVIEIGPDGVRFENLSNGRLTYVPYTMMDQYEKGAGCSFIEAIFWLISGSPECT